MSHCAMSPNAATTACWNLESAPALEIQSFPGCTLLAETSQFPGAVAHRGAQISWLSPQTSLDTLQVLQGHGEEAPGHIWVHVPGEAVTVQSNCQAQAGICPDPTGHPEEETRGGKEELTFFNVRKTCLFLSPCKIDDFYHLGLLCVGFWAEQANSDYVSLGF